MTIVCLPEQILSTFKLTYRLEWVQILVNS